VDEHCPALQIAEGLEGPQSGAAGQRQSARLLPAQALRLPGDRTHRDGNFLGEGSAAEHVLARIGDDFIADGEFRGVEAESDDDTGDVPARGDGELRGHDRVEVSADELPVDRVDSGGPDFDEHRGRRHLRIGQLADGDVVEVLGVGVVDGGAHSNGLPVDVSDTEVSV
jgi:hypothetical protein